MFPEFSRRSFLLGTTSLGLALALPSFSHAQNELRFETPLAIPPMLEGTFNDGVREYDLTLQSGISEFFKGYDTPTWGINGTYLGPLLKMRKGETVRVNVTNTLDETTTLHWHGFNLPAEADGGPHQPIKPGKTWSPEFKVLESAGLMWAHAHQMGKTAEHVWNGLATMVMIDDDEADALDLPNTYGVDDIPVVLQDRRFKRDGSIPYSLSMHDRMAGMMGNVPLLNGTVLPYVDVKHDRIRLRLLNGANASIYNLSFDDGRSFHQIGSDGGLLQAPVEISELRLAPGERADIVVDFSDGKPCKMISRSRGNGMEMMEQSPNFQLLDFRVAENRTSSPDLPSKLTDLAPASTDSVTNTRTFLLEMPSMGPQMMMGFPFTINGQEMDMARIDETVPVGQDEIWVIQNAGPMAHPFHVHNTQFRIVSRNGKAPASNEQGRKDTVLVEPGEEVRILIRFDHYTDPKRPYMYHCHILEHEDAGMMGQFVVV